MLQIVVQKLQRHLVFAQDLTMSLFYNYSNGEKCSTKMNLHFVKKK